MNTLCVDSLVAEHPPFQAGDGGSIPTSTLHISPISKQEAGEILDKYHYLSRISRGFRSGTNLGLFENGILQGVCIYTNFPVPELAVSIFGLSRTDHVGFFELSRLCLCPDIQQRIPNLASWFIARSLVVLRKSRMVRAVLSYADAGFHVGTVYKASGFRYYGLSQAKNDFWIESDSGDFQKCSRGGSVKHFKGEWRPRNRKHRYLKLFDDSLTVKWAEQKFISK